MRKTTKSIRQLLRRVCSHLIASPDVLRLTTIPVFSGRTPIMGFRSVARILGLNLSILGLTFAVVSKINFCFLDILFFLFVKRGNLLCKKIYVFCPVRFKLIFISVQNDFFLSIPHCEPQELLISKILRIMIYTDQCLWCLHSSFSHLYWFSN